MRRNLGATYITKEGRVKGNSLRREGIFVGGCPVLVPPVFWKGQGGPASRVEVGSGRERRKAGSSPSAAGRNDLAFLILWINFIDVI
jgi:hypothetical protein